MDVSSSEERVYSALRGRELFRSVNEKLQRLNEPFAALTGTFAVACECGRLDCTEFVDVPVDVYREARRSPSTYILSAPHVNSAIDDVVTWSDAYAVVDARNRQK